MLLIEPCNGKSGRPAVSANEKMTKVEKRGMRKGRKEVRRREGEDKGWRETLYVHHINLPSWTELMSPCWKLANNKLEVKI